MKNLKEQLYGNVLGRARTNIWKHTWFNVSNKVWGNVRLKVTNIIFNTVRSNVLNDIKDNIWTNLVRYDKSQTRVVYRRRSNRMGQRLGHYEES